MNDLSRLVRAVVVGSGRWAQVILRELDGVLPPDVPISVAGPNASNLIAKWNAAADTRRLYNVQSDIRDLSPAKGVSIAIVANRPARHASAAADMIERGYHVLVEKPFTADPLHARDLVTRAHRCQVALMVGLPFVFAPSIDSFRKMLPFPQDQITDIEFLWHDPILEERYGELKRPDQSVSIALDVVPHLWSILRVLVSADANLTMVLADVSCGGGEIEIEFKIGSARGTARLSRCAARRGRSILLRANGASAKLDFSEDPATVTIDGGTRIELASHDSHGSSLAKEFRFFIAQSVGSRDSTRSATSHLADATHTLEHVDLSCALDTEIRGWQRKIVRRRVLDGTLDRDQNALNAMRELMVEPLIAAGLAQFSGDEALSRSISALATAACGKRKVEL
jgi:predicted dehydrogenase